MPNDTTNVAVPAATWTKVVDGAIEAQLTGNDTFGYVFAPTDTAPAADMLGHFVQAYRQEVVVPVADQSVWVNNAHRALVVAVTTDDG